MNENDLNKALEIIKQANNNETTILLSKSQFDYLSSWAMKYFILVENIKNKIKELEEYQAMRDEHGFGADSKPTIYVLKELLEEN